MFQSVRKTTRISWSILLDLVVHIRLNISIQQLDENVKPPLSWINEKIEEHEGKKYLMVDVYMLRKVLDKIKEIINIE